MTSLTSCMKKAGSALHADDRKAIMAGARGLRTSGTPLAEAARQAVRDRIAEVEALLADSIAGRASSTKQSGPEIPVSESRQEKPAPSEVSSEPVASVPVEPVSAAETQPAAASNEPAETAPAATEAVATGPKSEPAPAPDQKPAEAAASEPVPPAAAAEAAQPTAGPADTPALSRSEKSPEANALKALSENDDLFQLRRSDADTVAGIAADVDPQIKVKQASRAGGRTDYTLTMPDGNTARMVVREPNPYGPDVYGYATVDGENQDMQTERPGENPDDAPMTGDVWIDVSLLESGKGGRHVYAIAANYAHNTDRIFIGDPAGLSDEAMVRRPEQMLSSALKFGTTAHLAPHPRQVEGDAALGVPALKWVYGDDLGNIERLIDLNLAVQENAGNTEITFDPNDGQFHDSTGQVLDREGISLLTAKTDLGRAGLAGATTLARSAVLRSLARGESQAGRGTDGRPDGVLEALLRLGSQSGEAAAGLFYSRERNSAGAESAAGAGLRRAAAALRGGRPVADRAARAAGIRNFVSKITERWANAPDVIVADSLQDESIPEQVRAYDQQQRSTGAAGQIEGLFYKGKVYLIADQLTGDADVLRVLMHESLGHYGLRGTFGKELGPILDHLAEFNESTVRAKAEQYGLDFDNTRDRRAAAEEVLAEMAQRTPNNTWVQQAVAAIRTWLREHVPGFGAMKLSDAELIRSYILPAREFVKGGGSPQRAAGLDGVMFSRSIGDTLRSLDQQGARNLFLDAVTSHKGLNLWQRTVGTQYDKAQKNPRTFGRVFNAVQDYIKDISVFGNAAADRAPSILPKLDNWTDLAKGGLLRHGADRADLKAAGHAIFKGTLEDAKVYTDAELAAQGLTPAQRGLYREFRAAVDQSLDDMGKTELVRLAGDDAADIRPAILDAADMSEAASLLSKYLNEAAADRMDPKLSDLAVTIGEKAAQVQKLKDEGYAPLMRFGKHTLHIQKDGATVYFGMYESQFEANRAARALGADPQFKGADIKQGLMSEQAFKLFSGLNLDSLELFAKATGNADNPVYQEYLKLAKNNRSAMKRMIHRQGIAGFSEDTSRVLASFVTSNARMASGNLHLGQAKQAADAIPKEMGDIKDEAIRLVDYVQNPQEEAAGIRALLFTNFIGGSVASAMVNLTQPFTMTLPYLSQFGGVGKAAGHLAEAVRTAAAGGATGALGDALKRAEKDGIVSPQEIHHLQAEAMSRLGNHPVLKKAAFVWGSMFSLAEQFNRRVTFIAAYNAALQQHIDNPFAFAEKAVVETQGLYNKGNKANWARGAIGATVMTFKQFSTHYLEFLTRMYQSGPEGKKAVAVALGILLLTAGTGGLPFADDLDDIIDTLAQAMGYDFSSKKAKRKFIAETLGFGDVGAELATRGLSSLPGMPIDLSLRMGLGNLLPGTGALLRSNTDRSRDVLEFAGAAGSLAKNFMDASEKALSGDFARAGVMVAPLAIQNMAKAAQMWDTGQYRNQKGQKVMDVDEVDGAMKFIGFQPSAVARESSRMGEVSRSKQLVVNVEAEIAGRWAQGVSDGDPDKVREARADLAQWNADNPTSQIRITNSQIGRRVMDLRASRAERTIKAAPKEMREAVREGLN